MMDSNTNKENEMSEEFVITVIDDASVQLSVRCQTYTIRHEDGDEMLNGDRVLWEQIAEVLNQNAAKLLPSGEDEDDDDEESE